MRRLLAVLTTIVVATSVVALPVIARPVARPHPVAPHVMRVPLRAVTAPGRTVAAAGLSGSSFSLVGATWRGAAPGDETRIQVRTSTSSGTSPWRRLRPADAAADGESADARSSGRVAAAEPLWTGPATGLEARVVLRPGARPPMSGVAVPAHLTVIAIDPGTSSADADPAATAVTDQAAAATSMPTIYSRSQWGADESLRLHRAQNKPCQKVHYADSVKVAFIHHTDSGNGYASSAVPSIIRGIYAYHTRSRGWSDIGYNYLVDRFGRIWEGRYGGIERAVVGAHTGGFNIGSTGVGLVGTFTSVTPDTAMRAAVVRLLAWKLAENYRDPIGSARLLADRSIFSRFHQGQRPKFNTISGHRNADFTSCPGDAAYALLPSFRSAVLARMGAGFVDPRVSSHRVRLGLQHVAVHAGVIARQPWSLEVRHAGTTVRRISGHASRSNPLAATWDLTDGSGAFVRPGRYTLQLTGANAHGTAVPWTTHITVRAPVTVHAPTSQSFAGPVSAEGRGVPGHRIRVVATDLTGTTRIGPYTVDRHGRWRTGSVAAAGDTTWVVHDAAAPGYTARATTLARPVIAPTTGRPVLVARGDAATLGGLAMPGTHVHLALHPVSSSTVTNTPAVVVAGDASWSQSFTPTAPTVARAVDGRGLRSASVTVYPVDPPSATAPGQGYAGRTVRVTGNAGNAPALVTLARQEADNSWTTVGTVRAGTDGSFALPLPLPDAAGTTVTWRVSTAYGVVPGTVDVVSAPPPTVTGPAQVRWNAQRDLTGTAVPGDVVTVYTKRPGDTVWVTAGQTRTASDGSWQLPVTFRHDTDWRAASRSGTSSNGGTLVVPTIHAPTSIPSGGSATVAGIAIPGRTLTLQRAAPGSTTWSVAKTVTVAADGRWRATVHPRNDADYRAVLRHPSHVVEIIVG